MKTLNWNKVKEGMPDYGKPVLAFFPELSCRGLPIEVIIREKGSFGDTWNKLTDMREHGLLAHYHEATLWIYVSQLNLPEHIKSDYVAHYNSTNIGFNDEMTTSNPFGFEDGF